MGKGRLEAFSEGVFAIIITIMVWGLRAPHGATLAALRPVLPVFLSYVLSFVFVGIYWNNHHHMFQLVKTIDGSVLWANLHLLFWLSLFPFANAWMGETQFARWPVIAYGVILLMAALAYSILLWRLIAANGREALDAVTREPFDVVLMDVQMPEMGGFEATAAIRALETERTAARRPIIAMTAHAMKGDRERCLAAGMDEYLTKPFEPDALVAAVARLAEG